MYRYRAVSIYVFVGINDKYDRKTNWGKNRTYRQCFLGKCAIVRGSVYAAQPWNLPAMDYDWTRSATERLVDFSENRNEHFIMYWRIISSTRGKYV